MRGGQPGPQPAKSAGPTAKLRASGPRARSKKRPAYWEGMENCTIWNHRSSAPAQKRNEDVMLKE